MPATEDASERASALHSRRLFEQRRLEQPKLRGHGVHPLAQPCAQPLLRGYERVGGCELLLLEAVEERKVKALVGMLHLDDDHHLEVVMADAQLRAATDGKAKQSTSLPRARVALDEVSLVQHIVQRLVDVVVVDEDNRTARGHGHLDPVDLLHQLQFRHVIREATAKEHVDLELAEQPAIEEQGQSGRIVREQHDVPRGPVLQVAAHQLQRRHSKPVAWSQERP